MFADTFLSYGYQQSLFFFCLITHNAWIDYVLMPHFFLMGCTAFIIKSIHSYQLKKKLIL